LFGKVNKYGFLGHDYIHWPNLSTFYNAGCVWLNI